MPRSWEVLWLAHSQWLDYTSVIILNSRIRIKNANRLLLGRKPTSSTSEANVAVAHGSMPWQTESTKGDEAREHFKYQYHPGGDPKNPPKDAPSALHSVIVPNVDLPKV